MRIKSFNTSIKHLKSINLVKPACYELMFSSFLYFASFSSTFRLTSVSSCLNQPVYFMIIDYCSLTICVLLFSIKFSTFHFKRTFNFSVSTNYTRNLGNDCPVFLPNHTVSSYVNNSNYCAH